MIITGSEKTAERAYSASLEGVGILQEQGLAVGAKGESNLDPITISAIILFGVSNEYELTLWDDYDGVYITEKTDDADLTYFELKGAYQLTDSLSAYLAYRSIDMSADLPSRPVTGTVDGFCIGVQYMF